MTRRGTLAYYLAAWVCGGFFFAAACFLSAPKSSDSGLTPDARGFLVAIFFVFAFGWVFTLGFALLLRLLARLYPAGRSRAWTISGAALALLPALAIAFLPGGSLDGPGWLRFLEELFALDGANGFRRPFHAAAGALSMVLAGMATAYVLYRVNRAFAEQEGASKS
jgi:hypothetical protein